MGELDGRPFNTQEALPLIRRDFDAAKAAAPGLIVKFDVMSSRDCTNGDCANSDKLPVASEAACAKVCGQVFACKWWVFGTEETDTMCWLRNGNKGLKPMQGSSVGRQSCQLEEDTSWSSWWVVGMIAIGAYYRKDLSDLMQRSVGPEGFKLAQRLASPGEIGSASLSSELLRVPGYGSSRIDGSSTMRNHQELKTMDHDPDLDGMLDS